MSSSDGDRRARRRPDAARRSAGSARATGCRRSWCSCSGSSLWEALVRGLDVESFLLPQPSDIAQALWTSRRALGRRGLFTFREAVGGYVIGSAPGVLVALVLARCRLLGTALMPYAIAASAIPIIAFAPITNNWFGLLNPRRRW